MQQLPMSEWGVVVSHSQLDETLVLVPHDEVTDLLRNELQIKLARSSASHAAQSSPPAHGLRPTLH